MPCLLGEMLIGYPVRPMSDEDWYFLYRALSVMHNVCQIPRLRRLPRSRDSVVRRYANAIAIRCALTSTTWG